MVVNGIQIFAAREREHFLQDFLLNAEVKFR